MAKPLRDPDNTPPTFKDFFSDLFPNVRGTVRHVRVTVSATDDKDAYYTADIICANSYDEIRRIKPILGEILRKLK